MLSDAGIRIGADRLRVVAATVAATALAVVCAHAQPGALPITEEEVYVFLSGHFEALATCQTDQLTRDFTKSARLTFRSTGGRNETFTPSTYAARMRRDCRAYRNIHWDRNSTSVATARDRASVQTQLAWGGQRDGQPADQSTLQIESRIEIVRGGQGELLISEIHEHFRELAPGAEQQFWAGAEGSGLFGAALRWYEGVAEMARDIMRRRQREHQP